MLVGSDEGAQRAEPPRVPFDTADRVGLAVLAAFPLTAAGLVVGGLLRLLS